MISETRFVGPDELLLEIRRRIAEGYSCRIAVAFLKTNGLNQLRAPLRKAKGEIVIGASRFFITDGSALSQLWKIGKVNPRLVVRRFFNAGFHPKIFYFEKGVIAQVILGSSNLTGGGLSGNVEANISVKGSRQDQLFVDVRNFLQKISDYSKSLNMEFVQEYNRESSNHNEKTPSTGRSDLEQDSLPKSSLTGLISSRVRQPRRMARWWKVAPGRDGSNWWRWKENIRGTVGYISYGGSKYGNLRLALKKSKDKALHLLEEKVQQKYQSSRPRQEARQLWTFGREIRDHDIVVAYSESTLFAIGEVISAYEHEPDLDQRYPHIRRVKWWTILGIRPPSKHLKVLATNDTVHEIVNRETMRYLNQLLKLRISRRN